MWEYQRSETKARLFGTGVGARAENSQKMWESSETRVWQHGSNQKTTYAAAYGRPDKGVEKKITR